MIDYEILRFIWWILIAVLLIGFAITDGFDMGVLNLLPIIGKSNVERRIMINTIAPHWDGKPSMVIDRWWCDLRCMANSLCNFVLGFLYCNGACACSIIFPPCRF